MQFKIPQFLDIEDKIFGPFTFKQFSYLLGAVAFAYIFWKLIPLKILAIPFILLFSGTFLALAFVKINNRPFVDILEAAYKYFLNNKTYLWKKHEESILAYPEKDIRATNLLKKSLNSNPDKEKQEKKITLDKLKELSGKLDILDETKKAKANLNLREELLKRNNLYKGRSS